MNHGNHKRSPGRACSRCAATEARCAFTGKCCDACTHFRHLDANGNEKQAVGRPVTSCEPCRFQRIACTHRLAS